MCITFITDSLKTLTIGWREQFGRLFLWEMVLVKLSWLACGLMDRSVLLFSIYALDHGVLSLAHTVLALNPLGWFPNWHPPLPCSSNVENILIHLLAFWTSALLQFMNSVALPVWQSPGMLNRGLSWAGLREGGPLGWPHGRATPPPSPGGFRMNTVKPEVKQRRLQADGFSCGQKPPLIPSLMTLSRYKGVLADKVHIILNWPFVLKRWKKMVNSGWVFSDVNY